MSAQTTQEIAAEKFKEEIKSIFDDGFHIDDRHYTISKMPFKTGRKIDAFYTLVADDITKGNLMFSDTPKFDNEILPSLMQYTMVDGFKLDTISDHFDNHTSDWNEFLIKAILGHVAPFISGSGTNSRSTAAENQTVTSRKPM